MSASQLVRHIHPPWALLPHRSRCAQHHQEERARQACGSPMHIASRVQQEAAHSENRGRNRLSMIARVRRHVGMVCSPRLISRESRLTASGHSDQSKSRGATGWGHTGARTASLLSQFAPAQWKRSSPLARGRARADSLHSDISASPVCSHVAT